MHIKWVFEDDDIAHEITAKLVDDTIIGNYYTILDDHGVEVVTQSIAALPQACRELEIEGKMLAESAALFAEFLKRNNTTIQTVRITNLSIEQDDFVAICVAVSQSRSAVTLEVRNTWSPGSLEASDWQDKNDPLVKKLVAAGIMPDCSQLSESDTTENIADHQHQVLRILPPIPMTQMQIDNAKYLMDMYTQAGMVVDNSAMETDAYNNAMVLLGGNKGTSSNDVCNVVRLEITNDRKGQAIQTALDAFAKRPSGKTLNSVYDSLCLRDGWGTLWMSYDRNSPSLQRVKKNLGDLLEEKNKNINRMTLSSNNTN